MTTARVATPVWTDDQLTEALDRLVDVVAALADRISCIEEYLEIVHDPAPWIVDIDVKGDRL